MKQSYYINKIISELEAKLKWLDIAQWTDIDYRKFSELLFEKTNVSISSQTFKRLFGKIKYKESYVPQPATKDALAKFLGYDDWYSFISSKNKKKDRTFSIKRLFQGVNFPKKTLIIFSVITLTLFLGLAIISRSSEMKVEFSAENISGTTPHTVGIHYDISAFKNKDVYIDFGEKEAEHPLFEEKLDKDRDLINHCFQTPGFYNIHIYSEDKILSSINVHVFSDDWVSYYFNDDNFVMRKFVLPLENKVVDSLDDSILQINQNDLNSQGFNGNTVYYLQHLQYRNFELAADNCTMEVKYKNSLDIGGISCYDVEFRIIGENGIVSGMLVQDGCYRWSEVTVGDTHFNGKYDNLAQLSSNMAVWNVMKIKVFDNKALFINNKDTLFSCSYKQPIGNIKGIRLVTKGSGAFDYVKLFDSQEVLKYDDYFND